MPMADKWRQMMMNSTKTACKEAVKKPPKKTPGKSNPEAKGTGTKLSIKPAFIPKEGLAVTYQVFKTALNGRFYGNGREPPSGEQHLELLMKALQDRKEYTDKFLRSRVDMVINGGTRYEDMALARWKAPFDLALNMREEDDKAKKAENV
jgi:hypothetical protein